MNRFEQVHVNAEQDKQRKRDAMKARRVNVYDCQLSTREALIAKAERDVLARKDFRGIPNRATRMEEEFIYICNEEGEWRGSSEMVIKHDQEFIADEIRKLVASFGVGDMSQHEIYPILNTVSWRYALADQLGFDKPPVVFKRVRRANKRKSA